MVGLALGGVALGFLLAARGPSVRPAATSSLSPRTAPARRPAHRRLPASPASRLLGLPPVPRGPIPGYVLIADRNNDRILLVSPSHRVVWRFPRRGDVRPGQSFHDPDDAFFAPGYRLISTNEEYNQTMGLISVRRHRIAWSYGHPLVRGSGPGYLSNPDDAYRLPNGLMMVADIQNCRVLWVNREHRVVREIGHSGACGHDPPYGLSSPNGATPLADGGVLVTEIGGWIDRFTAGGRLRYSVRTPTTYPSDAQLLPDGNILVAGFNTPGRVDELTPSGRIVWTFEPTGYWALDRPSLAVRWPNGMIAITDDWHHRVLVVDPRTKRVVWSYGHLNRPGTAAGFLDKPDGLDLLPASSVRAAARRPEPRPARSSGRARLTVTRVGSLPQPASRVAAVALPGGKVLALGGLVGGTSSDQVLLGSPSALRLVGHLRTPTPDAAAALSGGSVLLAGGGEAVSSSALVRVDPATGAARGAGSIGEPLSDLGAASVGGRAYLVGGWTGSRYATAVLRMPGAHVVARLPVGLRYAGVAALSGTLYVAGGLSTAGPSRAVYAVDPAAGSVRRVATLPAPIDHAPLAALGGKLLLVGGDDASGRAVSTILAVDPASGTVRRVGSLPQPLSDAAAVTVGGRVIVLGGGAANASAAVYALR